MVNGAILPFPPAGGADASRRPSSSAARRDDFAGAMHDALDAPRTTRRADDSRPARRLEPAKPRESDGRTTAPSRRAAAPARPPAAKKTDAGEHAADDSTAERADQPASDGVAHADSSETPKTEPKAKPAGDATGAATEPAADTAGTPGAGAAAGCAATLDDTAMVGDDDEEGVAGEDALARGRRWAAGAAGQAAGKAESTSNGAARRGAAAAGVPAKGGHGTPHARGEAGAAAGESLAEIAQEAVASAHADAIADAHAASGSAVTRAAETAKTSPQTASAADATTAIENAMSHVEAVASAEASAGNDANGSEAHEQPQPKPQAAGAQTNTSTTVAVAGPGDGPRFTVTSAAGNAAYTNAAPRHEEAVLPQLVQSIRLQAVQGTTEARVQLKPEHLGALNITLRVEQNQVTATIQADVAAVRQWIESHESSLRQALSEQGLHLAKLVVQPDGEQTSKDEQGEERPRREPRRRSWRDEEVTFEVLA